MNLDLIPVEPHRIKVWFILKRASLMVQMVKNLPAMREPLVRISGLGRYPGDWNGYPLQYSGLENYIDRGTCGLQFMGSQRVRHN